MAGQWRVLAVLLALCSLASVAHAQETPETKQLVWQRYDVDLDVQRDGRVIVTETQEVRFLSGTWRNGQREIPLDRVGDIGDLRLYEVDSGAERALPFDQQSDSQSLKLQWHYPTSGAGDVRTFRLRYTVDGVIRVYPDNKQIRWIAVPESRAFPVEESRVTLRLPRTVRRQDLVLASYPRRLGAEQETLPNGAAWEARNIGAYDGLEVRAQFPPGVVAAQAPDWQAEADELDYRRETVRPRVDLALLASALIILLLVSIFLITRWRSRGVDPPAPPGAPVIGSPPSDLPAPVVGVLVDERVDPRDVVSALLSLSARGYLRITPELKAGGVPKIEDHRLELLGDDRLSELRPYERILMESLFGERTSVLLSEARERFGRSATREFSGRLYEEATNAGLFRENPDKVRRRYRVAGVLVTVLGFLGCCVSMQAGFVATVMSYADVPFALLPAGAIFALGLGLILTSFAMPARTEAGAAAAASWRSFRTYLESLERSPDAHLTPNVFGQYLPYAIALGLGRSWVERLVPALRAAPAWYGPGIWYAGGTTTYHTGGQIGATGGPGGLDSLGGSLADLMDQASSAFSSGFNSGSGGSSGGFSGGGGGGFGGGSGGGSAGFS